MSKPPFGTAQVLEECRKRPKLRSRCSTQPPTSTTTTFWPSVRAREGAWEKCSAGNLGWSGNRRSSQSSGAEQGLESEHRDGENARRHAQQWHAPAEYTRGQSKGQSQAALWFRWGHLVRGRWQRAVNLKTSPVTLGLCATLRRLESSLVVRSLSPALHHQHQPSHPPPRVAHSSPPRPAACARTLPVHCRPLRRVSLAPTRHRGIASHAHRVANYFVRTT